MKAKTIVAIVAVLNLLACIYTWRITGFKDYNFIGFIINFIAFVGCTLVWIKANIK